MNQEVYSSGMEMGESKHNNGRVQRSASCAYYDVGEVSISNLSLWDD